MSRHFILVTGASGFVGQALCAELVQQGFAVRAVVRSAAKFTVAGCEVIVIPKIEGGVNWEKALVGVDTVIHLAARVHVMHDLVKNPLHKFRKVNLDATEHLAKSAATNKVNRLVFVSSIKVNGEETAEGSKFTELNPPAPQDAYAISKHEAELALQKVADETGLEVVIVRPPLIYGVGVKGNFAQMIRIINKGIPLPFAKVRNLRSLLYVGNFVSALILCTVHPKAAGKIFLLSDGEDLSTADLIRQLSTALGRSARLFSFPIKLLSLAAFLTGKSQKVKRLLGSLRIDSSKIREELDWEPKYSVAKGMDLTVKQMQENKS